MVLILAGGAQAIVISGGVSANNQSAPADDPGWARVGRVGTNGSGVYLGNGWVLTANHVSSKTYFTVEGYPTYNKIDGEQFGVQLRNTSDTGYIDLYMFRVDVSGGNLNGLGDMAITSSAPNNKQCVHIGTGDGQTLSTKTHWYVDTTPNPDVWSTSEFSGWDTDRYGYYWSGVRDTRWAYEDVYDSNYDFTISGMFMQGFTTDFIEATDYGMAADHDSGSGLFVKNGGVWELAGIAHAVGNLYSGQPSATGVYGNWSLYSDLSAYSDQITTIMVIPEPVTVWSLAILGVMMVLLSKRVR